MCSTHPGDHAEIDLRQADSASFFFGDSDVARHGDFETTPLSVTIDGRYHHFGGVLQAHEDFVAVKRKIIFHRQTRAAQHFDVGARGKKSLELAGNDNRMDIIIETGIENRGIEFLQQFGGVSVGRGAIDFQ